MVTTPVNALFSWVPGKGVVPGLVPAVRGMRQVYGYEGVLFSIQVPKGLTPGMYRFRIGFTSVDAHKSLTIISSNTDERRRQIMTEMVAAHLTVDPRPGVPFISRRHAASLGDCG